MQFCTEIKGPSLADVLAFTILQSTDDVARVERAAANRMAAVRGWAGWRIVAVEISDEVDDLARINVHAEPIGGGYRGTTVFDFLTGLNNKRPSLRFNALLHACGIQNRVDDTRELDGRYFATRNRGRTANDFGPLTNSLAG